MLEPPKDDDRPRIFITSTPCSDNHEWIKKAFLEPTWKCPQCGLTNFGTNKYCADWRCKWQNGR